MWNKYFGGGYLLFVDGDDKIDNNMCELLLKNMHMYHADISICNLYNNLQDKEKQKSKIFKLTPQKAIKDMLSEKFFNVSACGKLYKKELFQKIRFPEGVLFEDLATSYRLLDLCNSIVFTSKPLYFYRTRYGSIMNSSFQNEKIVFLDISNEMIQFLKIHYPDAISAAYNRSTRYCISFIKEIAMTDISYKDYENKLRKFISSHLFAYLKSDYKFSSKLFGFAIVINLTAAKIAYKFISNFSKYFTA